MTPGKRGRKPAPRSSARRAPATQQRRPPPAERGLGGDQVEGRQAVRELLLGGRRVRELWVATDLDDASVVDEILELARDMRVPIREVSRNKMAAEARTDAPQGVLAKAAPLHEVELDELAQTRAPSGGRPFLIVSDGVTDPGNLGALLRSASCAGTGVVLPRHRAVHVTPTVAKAAAGAIEHLPMALVGGIPNALSRLRELGVWVIGLDMVAERTIFELGDVANESIALVLGSEGHGLSRLTRQRCDLVVRIPIVGPLESLNVATAGALACYEITRQRIPHV
jgi:23S rRNA (guanosine2251-2'-O)-methyltransferase